MEGIETYFDDMTDIYFTSLHNLLELVTYDLGELEIFEKICNNFEHSRFECNPDDRTMTP